MLPTTMEIRRRRNPPLRPKMRFSDNDGSQSHNDGADAHFDIRVALLLADQRAGHGDQSIGKHERDHRGHVGRHAVGTDHVRVVSRRTKPTRRVQFRKTSRAAQSLR